LYRRGHSFGGHIDEPVESDKRESVSLFTLLLYMSGGDDSEPVGGERLRGGSTLFHLRGRPPIEVQPRTGTICLHYVLHDFLHEGLLVNSGQKWLLRTDVFFPKLRPGAGPAAAAAAAGAAGGAKTKSKGKEGGGGGKTRKGKKI
jgi:hypothetical protein